MKFWTLLSLLIFTASVSAHSMGASLEKVDGDYLIDIGVSEEPIIAGLPVRFSFELYSTIDESEVDFTEIWVLVREGTKTMLSANLHRPTSGLLPNLAYNFPKEGRYEFTARYNRGNVKIAEATFDIDVEKNPESRRSLHPAVFGLLGLIAGVAGSLIIRKGQTNE